MAIAITSSVYANDTTMVSSGLPITVSGRVFPTQTYTYVLRINGTVVATATSSSNSFTMTGITQQEVYDNAYQKSFTGAVELLGTYTTDSIYKYGNVSINSILTSFAITTPTSANTINLDLADPTNILTSWVRPLNHTGFYGSFYIQVGNLGNGSSTSWTNVYTSNLYATGVTLDVVTIGIVGDIVNAMGGSSPKDLRLQLYSRFKTGSSSYTLLSGSLTKVVAGAFVKSFVSLSDISISGFTIESALITGNIPYTLTKYTAGTTHTLKLYVNATLIKTITGITVSGSFDIDSTDITNMLNATDQVSSCSAYVNVETISGGVSAGSKNSSNVVVTVSSVYVPVFTAQAYAEGTTSPDVASLIGKLVQGISKVKATFSGNTTGTGTRIKQIKMQFDGQTITTDYTYASNTTTLSSAVLTTLALNNYGTLDDIILSIIDYRNRITTYTFNNIIVLQYANPKIISLDVVRCNKLTPFTDNFIGEFMKVYLNANCSSLINSTEKNKLFYRIGYKLSGAGSYTYYTAIDTSSLIFNSSTVEGTVSSQEFAIGSVYDIIVEVYDVLTSGSKTLQTDVLPYGKVLQMWGEKETSFGKAYSGTGIIDVGVDDNGISINADGDIYSNGVKLETYDWARTQSLFYGGYGNADLNNAFYTAANWMGSALVLSNAPNAVNGYYLIINIRHGGGISDGNIYGYQDAVGMTVQINRKFTRVQTNGIWSAWAEK